MKITKDPTCKNCGEAIKPSNPKGTRWVHIWDGARSCNRDRDAIGMRAEPKESVYHGNEFNAEIGRVITEFGIIYAWCNFPDNGRGYWTKVGSMGAPIYEDIIDLVRTFGPVHRLVRGEEIS